MENYYIVLTDADGNQFKKGWGGGCNRIEAIRLTLNIYIEDIKCTLKDTNDLRVEIIEIKEYKKRQKQKEYYENKKIETQLREKYKDEKFFIF